MQKWQISTFKLLKLSLLVFYILVSQTKIFVLPVNAQGNVKQNSGIISGSIWYSDKNFFSGDKVTIYTGVFNGSASEKIKGQVVFLNDTVEICAKNFELQPKSFLPVECLWNVPSGTIKISVETRSVLAVDKSGNTQEAKLENIKVSDKDIFVDTDTDGDLVGDRQDDDDDNDGLSDNEEHQLGTNPLVFDTDSDGLSDKEEKRYGANPLLVDTDNDGTKDKDEVIAGTSPTIFDGQIVVNTEKVAESDDKKNFDENGKFAIVSDVVGKIKPLSNEFFGTIKRDLGIKDNVSLSESDDSKNVAPAVIGRSRSFGSVIDGGSKLLDNFSFSGLASIFKRSLNYIVAMVDGVRVYMLSLVEKKLDSARLAVAGSKLSDVVFKSNKNSALITGASPTLSDRGYHIFWLVLFYFLAYKALFYGFLLLSIYKMSGFLYSRFYGYDDFYGY